MDASKLKEVLDAHTKWLRGEQGGVRANLSSANLSDTNLSYANLRSADLSDTNLRSANLSDTNLSYANLRSADLSYANLSSANLSYANLSYANLRSANLRSADLRYAEGVDDIHLKRQQIVPEVGPFVGFKKLADNIVAQLEITGERVGGVLGRKCRTSEARVLGFFAADETPLPEMVEGRSLHDSAFTYRLGEVVTPKEWNPSMTVECGGGIHFFLSFIEASEFSL